MHESEPLNNPIIEKYFSLFKDAFSLHGLLFRYFFIFVEQMTLKIFSFRLMQPNPKLFSQL